MRIMGNKIELRPALTSSMMGHPDCPEEEAGTIGYDLLDKAKDRVVLDIWMRSEKYCGHGYGSDALDILCNHIHKKYGITNFMISPSARNKRAIAAYEKAGFAYVKLLIKRNKKGNSANLNMMKMY